MLPAGQIGNSAPRLVFQLERRKLFLYGWKSLSFKWSLPSENNFSLASGLSGSFSSSGLAMRRRKKFLSLTTRPWIYRSADAFQRKFFSRESFFIPRQSSISDRARRQAASDFTCNNRRINFCVTHYDLFIECRRHFGFRSLTCGVSTGRDGEMENDEICNNNERASHSFPFVFHGNDMICLQYTHFHSFFPPLSPPESEPRNIAFDFTLSLGSHVFPFGIFVISTLSRSVYTSRNVYGVRVNRFVYSDDVKFYGAFCLVVVRKRDDCFLNLETVESASRLSHRGRAESSDSLDKLIDSRVMVEWEANLCA